MTIKARVARLEAKGGGVRCAEPILIFRRVIDVAGNGGELHSAVRVGGDRCLRDAGETEAHFEARAAS